MRAHESFLLCSVISSLTKSASCLILHVDPHYAGFGICCSIVACMSLTLVGAWPDMMILHAA